MSAAFSPLRPLAPIVLVLLALAGAGCSAVISLEGIEATDLSSIQVGTTRETVESVLGRPVESVTTESGKTDTYEYNRGRRPGKPEDLGFLRCSNCGSGAMGYALVYVLTQPYWINAIYKEQKGKIAVYYGPDDAVTRIVVGGHEGVANEVVARNAACGEPDSQYDIGWGYETGFSAIFHQPRAEEPVEAYFWYTLAAKTGHTAARDGVRRLEARLSNNDVGQVEQRASVWQPLVNCKLQNTYRLYR
jgi:hypothetical protein